MLIVQYAMLLNEPLINISNLLGTAFYRRKSSNNSIGVAFYALILPSKNNIFLYVFLSFYPAKKVLFDENI